MWARRAVRGALRNRRQLLKPGRAVRISPRRDPIGLAIESHRVQHAGLRGVFQVDRLARGVQREAQFGLRENSEAARGNAT